VATLKLQHKTETLEVSFAKKNLLIESGTEKKMRLAAKADLKVERKLTA